MMKLLLSLCLLILSCSTSPSLNRRQKVELKNVYASLYIGQIYPSGKTYLQKWLTSTDTKIDWPKNLILYPLESPDWQRSIVFQKNWAKVRPTEREKTKYLSSPKEDFFGDGYQKFKPDFQQVGEYKGDDKNLRSMNVFASSLPIQTWGKANYDLPKNLTEEELTQAVKLPEDSPEQYIKNLKYISSFQIEGLPYQFVMSEGQHAEKDKLARTWLIEVFLRGQRVDSSFFRQYKGPL